MPDKWGFVTIQEQRERQEQEERDQLALIDANERLRQEIDGPVRDMLASFYATQPSKRSKKSVSGRRKSSKLNISPVSDGWETRDVEIRVRVDAEGNRTGRVKIDDRLKENRAALAQAVATLLGGTVEFEDGSFEPGSFIDAPVAKVSASELPDDLSLAENTELPQPAGDPVAGELESRQE